MTISNHSLSLQNGVAQPVVIPGGFGEGGIAYLCFGQAPSAGTVLVQGVRPGGAPLVTIYNGPAVQVGARFDSGYERLLATFSGIAGGSGALLSVVNVATAYPPSNLLTDGGFGPSARLRVDTGQTGFFAGRMFRSFIQGVIPVAGPSFQFRIVSPVDFILWSNEIELTQGAVQMNLYVNATPSGTWTAAPRLGVNRMISRPQPYYESAVILESGGNFTGGSLVDPIPVRAPAGNQNADNVKSGSAERGLPPGTYYGRISTLTGGLQVNDDAHFVYKPVWEERP